jgi:hypothetical protein
MLKRIWSAGFLTVLWFPAAPAFAASVATCRNYAREAVNDYKLTVANSKCRVKSDPRWQTNYENHYKWCLTAPVEWVRAEEKARDTHLRRCGVRVNID